MSRTRIAVVGGVAAGPAAAAHAARVDPEAEVVLFEQGPHISYSACEMPAYVAGEVDEAARLVRLTPGVFAQTRGAEVRTGHRVQALHPRRNHLVAEDLAQGRVYEERFDKVILAVGARARRPEVPGAEASNVFVLRRLDDAVALRAALEAEPVGHAVVLGAGYVGVEVAEALRHRGVRVSLLDPGGALGTYLDAELQPLVEAELARQGVTLRRERATAFRLDARGRVCAVETDRGERIGCSLVVVALGIVPNTALAQAAGVRLGATGALAVDDGMRTNVPGVWACGDCVEVRRVVDGARIYWPLSPVAFRTARVAAENAARRGRGAPARFEGVTGASAVRVFGLEVATVGLKLAEARAAGFDAFAHTIRHPSRAPLQPGSAPLHVRLVAARGTGRLLGAELAGTDGAALRADVLVPLVRDGWTADRLWDLDLIYTPPFAPALDALLVAGREAAKRARRP